MEVAEIKDIECAILHDRFAPLSGQQLFDLVSSVTRDIGLTDELKGGSTDEFGITAMVAGMHILVSQNNQPLAGGGFASALAQPITQMMMPDAKERIARHRANTFITVSKGMHIPHEAKRNLEALLGGRESPLQGFTDVARVKSAMLLVYKIANAIQNKVYCSAVHWCASDFLVSPQFMDEVGKGPTLTPLAVRPSLFSSANQLGRGLPVGMVANGSQYLMGRPVVFKEAIVELPWMLERVSNFIDMCHIRGSVIAHGESFGISDEEVISVAHMPASTENPLGTYELSAVHVPKFGILSRTASQGTGGSADGLRRSDVETKLDPNDPIDRAILERLEERRIQEDRRVYEERRSSNNQGNYPNDRRVANGTFGRRAVPFDRRD